MEELQRLQASRRAELGHRGHLTKLLKKSKEIIEHQAAIDDLTRALAETTLEQLRRKQDVLKEIDGNIQQKIAEITEAKGFQDEIAENIAQIVTRKFNHYHFKRKPRSIKCQYHHVKSYHIEFHHTQAHLVKPKSLT